MKRPPGILALSDWELDEMLLLRRRGWTNFELANFYGISTKSVERYCKRAGADTRPAASRVGGRKDGEAIEAAGGVT